ncbi:hypothetical protein MIR68_002042 [Amoeboaphelidium protococcarum]|nr:hypothetical protein MIR68_002042 [Amoeboaphelidium protococcarum]
MHITQNINDQAVNDEKTTDAKMLFSFKCNQCQVRTTKFISKLAYTKGVVLVKCSGESVLHEMLNSSNQQQMSSSGIDSEVMKTIQQEHDKEKACGALHLVADRLGWFHDQQDPRRNDVENILRSKGQSVTRITQDQDLAEFIDTSDTSMIKNNK